MSMWVSLSEVKARLSEFIRLSRSKGETIVITVDSLPAAELRAISPTDRQLSPSDILLVDSFIEKMQLKDSQQKPYSALELIKRDRR